MHHQYYNLVSLASDTLRGDKSWYLFCTGPNVYYRAGRSMEKYLPGTIYSAYSNIVVRQKQLAAELVFIELALQTEWEHWK